MLFSTSHKKSVLIIWTYDYLSSMNVRKYFPVFLLCCLACNHKKQEISGEKFDKAKWIIQSGKEYPYRDLMLND